MPVAPSQGGSWFNSHRSDTGEQAERSVAASGTQQIADRGQRDAANLLSRDRNAVVGMQGVGPGGQSGAGVADRVDEAGMRPHLVQPDAARLGVSRIGPL